MDEATFHQRMTALAKLVDRFPKVTSWLPQDSSQVVRIVYQDPDGSVHESPPWTRRTAHNAWKLPVSARERFVTEEKITSDPDAISPNKAESVSLEPHPVTLCSTPLSTSWLRGRQ
jgi:hypothetical protein